MTEARATELAQASFPGAIVLCEHHADGRLGFKVTLASGRFGELWDIGERRNATDAELELSALLEELGYQESNESKP